VSDRGNYRRFATHGIVDQTIERLLGEIAAAGCKPRGLHHEIYLGDPRRAAQEKLKTILRHPVV
jgi:hypothetical protein